MTRMSAIVLAALICPAAGAEDVDLDALLAEAEKVQRQDLAAWKEFRFQREVVRRELDAALGEKKREILRFIVWPRVDGVGFDEQLVLIDGRLPSPRLRDQHREAARFTKRYLQALGQSDEIGFEANPIVNLWDAEHYEYSGLERIGGVPCHRVEMKPSPEPASAGVKVRLAAATFGTLYLAVDGLRIVRSETGLARGVRLPMRLGTLERFDVRLVTFEPAEGTRLPAEIDVASQITVLGKTIRKKNRYRYSRFVAIQARAERSERP